MYDNTENKREKTPHIVRAGNSPYSTTPSVNRDSPLGYAQFAIAGSKRVSYFMERETIILGGWTEDKLDHILREASEIREAGERIDFISNHFLGIDYKESTLTGAINRREELVMNLGGIDCFTFIDYVEAMRLSASFPEFKEILKKVRYRSGEVVFTNRNHFFTDWAEFNSGFVRDVTGQLGGRKAATAHKELNKKEDGTCYLEGIRSRQREIGYIPSDAIDRSVADKIKTGDYIGIYSMAQGLDVSHAGIFIRHGEETCLRHASSAKEHRKVIDQDFKSYIAGKPGIIVLRPE
ncbi:MAG: DUF1460 domain-containing protein [Nitrospirae bacterium]|nr:DUF1460 domain-containing protein [Nitrospirota bacterium]